MSKFNEGDRVRYVGNYTHELINAEGTVRRTSLDGKTVVVTWDHGQRPAGVIPENVEKISPTPPAHAELIGRAPVVVPPRHVAPFKADGAAVFDANGNRVGEADSNHEDYESGDDDKIAEVFAAALNAYFGVK